MTHDRSPSVFILADPNGAGKLTAALFLVKEALGVETFVNADDLARGLSGFAPDTVAFAAGRLMLRRLNELEASRGRVHRSAGVSVPRERR